MKETLSNFLKTIINYIKIVLSVTVIVVVLGLIFIPDTVVKIIPSFSWFSTALTSDNYSRSIITEVEASGHNIRSVQSIDAFGRVCTSTFANSGMGLDCDYPPVERRDWTIEDYKKLLKK